MIQLLQTKGVFGGLAYEDPHNHLRNFKEVCRPFVFKNISQESIGFRLLPFSIIEEAKKWLGELPSDFVTSWDELTEAFLERFFPASKMVKLRHQIQNFKCIGGGNEGWNKNRDSGWKDWRDGNLRDREMDKDRYVPTHDHPSPKESAGLEGSGAEDMLVRIYDKAEGSNKVLKDLKNDFSTLSQMVTSHLDSLKQLETQLGQIVTHLNPRQKGTLRSDTISNPKNDC
ncbi:hypothetical protein MTR67_007287 [Solanum verrucosum]|uniref:Retrotransposon gag domain-containing protein n=1 Tax=Solanum verrucosum TaxID=315347 RepID=A0AAF0PZK3_SOLVR|nr:hypothetical protein MTR67_007287 [Solanum verrucosum]